MLGSEEYTDADARAAVSCTVVGITYDSATGVFSTTTGYGIPSSASQANWDTAYSERRQWDGGSSNLVAATGRTSLGLGDAAVLNVGTAVGTVSAGDHAHTGVYDPAGTGASEAASAVTGHTTTFDHSHYDTCYSWGNHASAGYLKADGTVALTGAWTVGNKDIDLGAGGLYAGYVFAGGLDVNGTVGTPLVPEQTLTYNLGSPSNRWNAVYCYGLSVSGPLTGFSSVAASLIPYADNTYDMGSLVPQNRWRNLYVSDGIYDSALTNGRVVHVGANGVLQDSADLTKAALVTCLAQYHQWDGGSTNLVAATGRTSLGLGDSAVKNVGTGAGDVSAGDHVHTGVYDPAGTATSAVSTHESTYNHANYNTAYGWGDHSIAGYAVASSLGGAAVLDVGTTAGTVAAGDHSHTGTYDPAGTASSAVSTHESTYNHSNYATAYGWGNHASAGYALASSLGDAATKNVGTTAGTVAAGDHAHSGVYDVAGAASTAVSTHESTYNHGNYNTAYGWGNHASAGYAVASSLGGAAVLDVGTTAGTVAAGDHNHSGVYLTAAITSLNGLTGASQTFSTPGTSGTAPAWSSTGTAHTLNIPMASAAGVTAGLISKTDYDAFVAGGGGGYTPGGDDVALADGGTGASLADPNADRILFWDDTAGGVTWLACGNSVAIVGTTLDAVQDIRTTASPYFSSLGIGISPTSGNIDFGGDSSRYVEVMRRTTSDYTGSGLTISAGGAKAGKSNKNGGDLTLSSGISTGTGRSNVYIAVPPVGTTGTADNATARVAKFGWSTTGPVLVLSTSTTILEAAPASGNMIQCVSEGTGVRAGFWFQVASASSAIAPLNVLARSRGTLTSPAYVLVGDRLGTFTFTGVDTGLATRTAATFQAEAAAVGASYVSGRFVISTADSSGTLVKGLSVEDGELTTTNVKGAGLNLTHAVNKIYSDTVRHSHDDVASTTSTTYVKIKTITFPNGLLGSQRFSFTLQSSNTLSMAYGRLYRNGVALGTEQSTNGGGSPTTQIITQDWEPGDTAEIWAKVGTAGYTTSVFNFRVLYNDSPTVAVASVNS